MPDIFSLCVVTELSVAPTNSFSFVPPLTSSSPHRARHRHFQRGSSFGVFTYILWKNAQILTQDFIYIIIKYKLTKCNFYKLIF